jgi:hypothetical protein
MSNYQINTRIEKLRATGNSQEFLDALHCLELAIKDLLENNPTFKFAVSQEVWFLKNDKVQKGNVRVRQITESSEKLRDEVDYFNRSTDDKLIIVYSLSESKTADPNWLLDERTLFASKADLLESL